MDLTICKKYAAMHNEQGSLFSWGTVLYIRKRYTLPLKVRNLGYHLI